MRRLSCGRGSLRQGRLGREGEGERWVGGQRNSLSGAAAFLPLSSVRGTSSVRVFRNLVAAAAAAAAAAAPHVHCQGRLAIPPPEPHQSGVAAAFPVVIGREGVAHSALSIHQLENANLHTNLHSDSCHTGRRLESKTSISEKYSKEADESVALHPTPSVLRTSTAPAQHTAAPRSSRLQGSVAGRALAVREAPGPHQDGPRRCTYFVDNTS
ncbi:hypothetical protein E2C01_032843 [Portunus trituberculatus]|uniref:Uncharacterized protein n=1 Tax=Portunus trituberculatus TaxID=210409 RepID=A0A5B7EYI8_PORTR|nr:hypothetical protein [Portunus trituberculatus]